MARNAVPSYRKQKSKSGDRAFVEVGRTRHYLGAFGSDESREKAEAKAKRPARKTTARRRKAKSA